MDRLFYFVYRTENKINSKYYIGAHSTSDPSTDTYLGSGDLIRKAVKKYGKENFERKILKYCNSMTEAYEKEAEYVTAKEVLDPNCYNLKQGGLGGMKGTVYVTKNSVRRRILPQDLESFLKDGWIEGMELSKETVKKLQKSASQHHKGIPQSKESNEKRSRALKGRPLSEDHRSKVIQNLNKHRYSCVGTKIVHNDRIQLRVPEKDLEYYKNLGYEEGCLEAFEGCKGKFYVEKEGKGLWVSRKDYWRYIRDGYKQYTIKQLKSRISQGEFLRSRDEN